MSHKHKYANSVDLNQTQYMLTECAYVCSGYKKGRKQLLLIKNVVLAEFLLFSVYQMK